MSLPQSIDADRVPIEGVESLDPEISVVLPVYHCARVIVRAVESVLRRTFASFERIVVDDAYRQEEPETIWQTFAADPELGLLVDSFGSHERSGHPQREKRRKRSYASSSLHGRPNAHALSGPTFRSAIFECEIARPAPALSMAAWRGGGCP